jgi:hypothetical protein
MPKVPKSKSAIAAMLSGVAVIAALCALTVMSTTTTHGRGTVHVHVETPDSDGTTPALAHFHALDEGHDDHTYVVGEDTMLYVETGAYEIEFIPPVNSDRTSYKDYTLSYNVVDGENAAISTRLDHEDTPRSRVELTHLYNKVIQLEPTAASTDVNGVGNYVKRVGELIVAD